MDIENLKQIVELLRETDITEIQVEKDGEKVCIKRGIVSPPGLPAAQTTIYLFKKEAV